MLLTGNMPMSLRAMAAASSSMAGVRSMPVTLCPSFAMRMAKNPVPVPTSRMFSGDLSGSRASSSSCQRRPMMLPNSFFRTAPKS